MPPILVASAMVMTVLAAGLGRVAARSVAPPNTRATVGACARNSRESAHLDSVERVRRRNRREVGSACAELTPMGCCAAPTNATAGLVVGRLSVANATSCSIECLNQLTCLGFEWRWGETDNCQLRFDPTEVHHTDGNVACGACYQCRTPSPTPPPTGVPSKSDKDVALRLCKEFPIPEECSPKDVGEGGACGWGMGGHRGSCAPGLSCECIGECAVDMGMADIPSVCVAPVAMETLCEELPITQECSPKNVTEGGMCGWGMIGHLGTCATGLSCECVGECADPFIADIASSCVTDSIVAPQDAICSSCRRGNRPPAQGT